MVGFHAAIPSFGKPEATMQGGHLIAEYRHLFAEMIAVYRELEKGMTRPELIPAGSKGRIMRLPVQDAPHALLLKVAALLSFLNGAIILCDAGSVLAQGAVERMADEAGEDVIFLSIGLVKGLTDRHIEFLDFFWREDFADFDDPMNSLQSRPQVSREKIRAAIHSISEDPSTGNKASKVLTKSYSGFVHAAAPHVMELYDAERGTFQVDQAPSYRHKSHQDDLWNYMYRGATAVMFAARALGVNSHERIEIALQGFQERTGRDVDLRKKPA
jgi:hypothetical protein